MTAIIAKNLTLNEVSEFLKFQQLFNNETYPSVLSLEPLTEFEQL